MSEGESRETSSQDLLHKEFAKEYVANGLNGRMAYKKVKGASLAVSGVQATRLLKKDKVKKHIADLLPSNNKDAQILADVYKAPRQSEISYKDLHKYWETSLKLKGYLNDGKGTQTINIGIATSN